MSVYYEWRVEELDGDDIVDSFDFPDYETALVFHNWLNELTRIVLVRDSDHSRAWAYMTSDGKLPESFCDAHNQVIAKVPQRFHKEVAQQLVKVLEKSSAQYHDGNHVSTEELKAKLKAKFGA